MHRTAIVEVTGTGITNLLAQKIGIVVIGIHIGLTAGIIGAAVEDTNYMSGNGLVSFIFYGARGP
ncbi:hypothetical protein BDV12DRAFT_176594 [Aspergillus spectabilis]